jgi:hypothetical protein
MVRDWGEVGEDCLDVALERWATATRIAKEHTSLRTGKVHFILGLF